MQLTRTTKYLLVTTTYKHTVDATEIVECRCLVILARMCLPIQLSAFVTRSRAGFASVSLFFKQGGFRSWQE